MTKVFSLQAKARQDVGKGASRRLRRASQVPAIVYGTNKVPQNITLTHHEVANALKNESFYTKVLTLNIDGLSEQVVLRDLQRHPFKSLITHMDFQRISATEKLTMIIPLHFVGADVAPGVKIDGGVVAHLLSEVNVRCLPKDLPEYISVDISQLCLNHTLHLADLLLPAGVELVDLMHGENKAVVTIYIPRAVVETAVETAVAATTAEAGAAGAAAGTEEAKAGTADKGKVAEKAKSSEKPKGKK